MGPDFMLGVRYFTSFLGPRGTQNMGVQNIITPALPNADAERGFSVQEGACRYQRWGQYYSAHVHFFCFDIELHEVKNSL